MAGGCAENHGSGRHASHHDVMLSATFCVMYSLLMRYSCVCPSSMSSSASILFASAFEVAYVTHGKHIDGVAQMNRERE